MTTSTTTTNRMAHDKGRDQYVGEIRLRITVPGDRYRQVFNQQISESPGLDLSDPGALELLRAKLADPLYWRGKPQATILELPADSPASAVSPSPSPIQQGNPPVSPVRGVQSHSGTLRERVKEQARVTPPHLWLETIQQPLPERETTGPITKEERGRRQVVWNRNHDIRTYLGILREEWEAGTFQLSAEAMAAEEVYQEKSRRSVSTQSQALALLTNTSRLDGNFATAGAGNGVHSTS